MTTVATDGKSMAADGLVMDHRDTIVDTEHRKVHRLADGRIIGGAGNSADIDAWRAWLESGREGECPIDSDRFVGLILSADGTVHWVDCKGREMETPVPCACGSGQDYAYGAMAVGASPALAIAAAISRDPYSGGTIIVEHLDRAHGA